MATEEALRNVTFPANTDLSTKQYYFMVINSSGNLAVAGAGNAQGVLQNKPAAAGRAGTLGIEGATKIFCGGTINPGDEVTSDASGKCVAAGSGERVLGICREAGTNGLIASILLLRSASIA